ncbi:Hypothetical predicted protein [Lecanosticta acicola]|uniref:Uncharacterized protein n=1 Tax=Lecanosticta acicola TaxID=111012 RepID=A0AAI9EAC2_9PEZI|nr:Hypothetical predicted protein [Lecanosticta acicola]
MGLHSRDVGYSSSLDCDDDSIILQKLGRWHNPRDEFDKLSERNHDSVLSCLAQSGNLVKHPDTVFVVKDMTATRIALAASKISIMGFSYGTQMTAEYISLFLQQVGQVRMDGALDHTTDKIVHFIEEGKSVDSKARELWGDQLKHVHNGKMKVNYAYNRESNGRKPQQLISSDILQVVRAFLYSAPSDWVQSDHALNDTAHANIERVSIRVEQTKK